MTTKYLVNTVYPSIQGEGMLTGTPMVILRLQGCGVGCPWCDTKETWAIDAAHQVDTLDEAIANPLAWAEIGAAELADSIAYRWPQLDWVLVTGGEPGEQDCYDLVAELQERFFRVAVETSGTAEAILGCTWDHVTVSPKIGMPGGKPIVNAVVREADEVKHVVGRQEDIDRLDVLLRETDFDGIVSLQPVSQSEKATALCVETCLARGWNLSVQTHKYLRIP